MIKAKDREQEKEDFRKKDMCDISEGRKTVQQVNDENTAIKPSGKRINFKKSKSHIW